MLEALESAKCLEVTAGRIWKLAWAGRSISGGACEALVDVAWSGMSKGLGLRSRA